MARHFNSGDGGVFSPISLPAQNYVRPQKEHSVLALMHVSIPVATARVQALAGNRALADHPLFQVKVALSEAFGEGTLRPWRLLQTQDGVHTVVGWSRQSSALQANPNSRRLGIIVENLDWTAPAAGDVLALDVLAIPHKKITLANGRRFEIDVSSRIDAAGRVMTTPPSERPAIWSEWFARDLGAPRTGMTIEGRPTIVYAERISLLRAERETPLSLQTARALVRATINEPSAFLNFLGAGFKKSKDMGMGCILPAELTLPTLLAEAA